MIQILLADDDILSLNRLSGLFDWNANGYEIVGQALGGADCLKLVDKFKPDILILDIDMPDKNGVEVTRQLQEQHCKTKSLFSATMILMISSGMPCGTALLTIC